MVSQLQSNSVEAEMFYCALMVLIISLPQLMVFCDQLPFSGSCMGDRATDSTVISKRQSMKSKVQGQELAVLAVCRTRQYQPVLQTYTDVSGSSRAQQILLFRGGGIQRSSKHISSGDDFCSGSAGVWGSALSSEVVRAGSPVAASISGTGTRDQSPGSAVAGRVRVRARRSGFPTAEGAWSWVRCCGATGAGAERTREARERRRLPAGERARGRARGPGTGRECRRRDSAVPATPAPPPRRVTAEAQKPSRSQAQLVRAGRAGAVETRARLAVAAPDAESPPLRGPGHGREKVGAHSEPPWAGQEVRMPADSGVGRTRNNSGITSTGNQFAETIETAALKWNKRRFCALTRGVWPFLQNPLWTRRPSIPQERCGSSKGSPRRRRLRTRRSGSRPCRRPGSRSPRWCCPRWRWSCS
ncbi:uncharacterized protein [Desmodus rotundus]|uniref:uncharacterized protein n=1 Tax=Desmodus rotundus TaxID=9430 RepID=UPI0039E70FA1